MTHMHCKFLKKSELIIQTKSRFIYLYGYPIFHLWLNVFLFSGFVSRLPLQAFPRSFTILLYRSSLGETGIFPQHPAPALAVDENGGQLIGGISTNTYWFYQNWHISECILTYYLLQVEIVEGCRLPVLRKNQEHEDEWRMYCPVVVKVLS